ncbi:hypothetical protein ACT5GY_02980 [Lactiplantibacillus plantarum]
MANKRPLNLVQLVADYFDTKTLSETSECILYFVETFNVFMTGNSEIVSHHNIIFGLTVD